MKTTTLVLPTSTFVSVRFISPYCLCLWIELCMVICLSNVMIVLLPFMIESIRHYTPALKTKKNSSQKRLLQVVNPPGLELRSSRDDAL